MAKLMEKARHDNATTPNISAWFNDVLLPVFAKHKYDWLHGSELRRNHGTVFGE